jgi:hypothetical protein
LNKFSGMKLVSKLLSGLAVAGLMSVAATSAMADEDKV